MKRLSTALLLMSLGACAWWMAGRPGAPRSESLTFSHAGHEENGASCSDCHGNIGESENLKTHFLPAEEDCMACHDRESDCASCHPSPERVSARVTVMHNAGFSHKVHLERTKGECAPCHDNAMQSQSLPAGRPTMDSCLSCHAHAQEYATGQCLGCHEGLQDQNLRAVSEFEHGAFWLKEHGAIARQRGESCMQCHRQERCAECHSQLSPGAALNFEPELGIKRTHLHRDDFARSHGLEASAGVEICSRCHGTNFCGSCHEARGVLQGNSRPHPEGYVLPGGAFHGDDARHAPQRCAACHGLNECAQCHQSGGMGGNPHPQGFGASPMEKGQGKGQGCGLCHLRGVP